MNAETKLTMGKIRAKARREMAAALRFDLNKLSTTQELKLSQATALRVEIDHLEVMQVDGEWVDVAALNKAMESLLALLPGDDAMDLTPADLLMEQLSA